MTSMLTATAGVGGGILLFAIMAWVMPLTALIPIHGVVQLGSNVGRLLLMLRSVRLTILLPFLAGSAIGGALGAVVVVQLPPSAMQIVFGAFVLWAAWMKMPSLALGREAIGLAGLVITFLTMFIGATGALIASVLKLLRLDRLSLVATQSACSVAQHAVKVIAFSVVGFAFAPYMPLVMAMIVAGFIGTYIGTHLLRRMEDQRFHLILSCVLTVLALGLLTKGTAVLILSPSATEAQTIALAASGETPDDGEASSAQDITWSVDRDVERRRSSADGDHSSEPDFSAIWQAANRWLERDLKATRTALSTADRDAHELVESIEPDRLRMAALEQEFEAIQGKIRELRSQAQRLTVPSE